MQKRRRILIPALLAAALGRPSSTFALVAGEEHAAGLASEAKGASSRGLVHLRFAHLAEPQNPRYLYDLVKALLRRKREREAVAYGEQLLREHPGTSYANETRGHLVKAYRTLSSDMQAASRWEEALVALEHALALDPAGAQSERLTEELTQGYVHLTGLYVRAGQYEWAVDTFEGLANLRQRPGFDKERISAVVEGQGLGQPMPHVFVKAAEARRQRGDLAGAAEMFTRFRRLLPEADLPKAGRALEQSLVASAEGAAPGTGSGGGDDEPGIENPGN